MSLDGFQVIQDEHALDGVAIHCWDGNTLILALVTRQAIDDTFDHLRPYEEHRRRLTKKQGNLLVEANLAVSRRIIETKRGFGDYVLKTESGYERPVVMITRGDIERSGEKFSAGVLPIASGCTWVDVYTGLPE